ncbi:MAG: sulfatase-like hydrolase/transferase, partial [Polyangiaceae bacterium]
MRRAPAIFVIACAAVACSKASSSTPSTSAAVSVIDASVAPVSSANVVAGPYNILFITIDSMRADMPWAGYPRAIAPNLTALAARSTVYTHAYSISSYTSKSVAGMLSGKYPSELARTGVFFTKYDASNTFMCETLEKQAIPCVAAEAHAYLKPGYAGLDQGFHSWKIVDGLTLDYQRDPY